MDLNHSSWEERWQAEVPGFHQADVNDVLVNETDWLMGPTPGDVYVPLCGATVDMDWLAQRFRRVIGTELVETAITRFFGERSLTPTTSEVGRYTRYASGNVHLLHGDALQLTPEDLGPIHAWYDRAAMIALRSELRAAYVSNLKTVLPIQARGLLITLEYDQSIASGPPWSVSYDEVMRVYGDWCDVERIVYQAANRTPSKFGDSPVHECAYRLTRRE